MVFISVSVLRIGYFLTSPVSTSVIWISMFSATNCLLCISMHILNSCNGPVCDSAVTGWIDRSPEMVVDVCFCVVVVIVVFVVVCNGGCVGLVDNLTRLSKFDPLQRFIPNSLKRTARSYDNWATVIKLMNIGDQTCWWQNYSDYKNFLSATSQTWIKRTHHLAPRKMLKTINIELSIFSSPIQQYHYNFWHLM